MAFENDLISLLRVVAKIQPLTIDQALNHFIELMKRNWIGNVEGGIGLTKEGKEILNDNL